jgi:hypothetical protein
VVVEQQEHLCEDCGLPLVRKNGKGPWPRRCAQCKRKRHTAGRQAIAEGREPTDDEKLNPQPAVPQNPGESGEPKEQDQQDPEPQQPQDASSPRRGRPLKPLKWFEHTLHPDDASADGPDDAQHIACRQAAYDAAVAQGLTPRGGWSTFRLLRIDTTGEHVGYVYGAVVRP